MEGGLLGIVVPYELRFYLGLEGVIAFCWWGRYECMDVGCQKLTPWLI